jgi:DNA-binding beta-propeller fold protein YncE
VSWARGVGRGVVVVGLRLGGGRGSRRLAGLLGVVVVLGVGVGLAQAGDGIVGAFGGSGSGLGQLLDPRGVSVGAGGFVVVGDAGNQRVQVFDGQGAPVRTWGWGVRDGAEALQVCTSDCVSGVAGGGTGQFSSPHGVAVNGSTGDVYVMDRDNQRVQQFDADGGFVRAWGWGVADDSEAFQVCDAPGPCQAGLAGSGDGQFAGSGASPGVAVDPSDGSVYVADPGNNRIQKFDASGAFLTAFGVAGTGDGEFGPGSPERIAVDSTGDLFATDPANQRVQRFNSGGVFEQIFGTDLAGETAPVDVQVDTADGHVFVLKGCTAALCPDANGSGELRVFEFDTDGTLIDSHLAGNGIGGAQGLALNSDTGRIYLASGDQIYILGSIEPPTVTVTVSDITDTSALFEATVDPNGSPASFHFEYSTNGTDWTNPVLTQEFDADSDEVTESVQARGLDPNTSYQVRVVVSRPFGNAGATSEPVTFTTDAIAPLIAMQPTTASEEHAVLRSRIDPQGSPTSYHYQWGSTDAYGHSTPAQNAGSGTDWVIARAPISGLDPNSTYHYRLIANSPADDLAGPDRTLTTGPGLPDNRAYELVSPPDKNGTDVLLNGTRTRVSTDGDAVQFASLGAFADARGTGVATEYISRRASNGWITHSITPHQNATRFDEILVGPVEGRYALISDDLSSGLFVSNRLLSDEGAGIAGIDNLYVRRDLLSPGPGTYELVTDAAAPIEPLTVPSNYTPWPAGVSNDFSRVLFSSTLNLTAEAPAQDGSVVCPRFEFAPPQFPASVSCVPRVYEWVRSDGLRLAGILPESEGGGPAASSIAGSGASFGTITPHTISQDGSRVFFTDQDVPDSPAGRLYLRENGATTRISDNAMYETASADGSIVYYGSGGELIRYDVEAPEDEHTTLLSRDDEPRDGLGGFGGFVGVGEDGSHVYFLAASQLVPGGPSPSGSQSLLFEWHDGQTSYIGTTTDKGSVTSRLWQFTDRTSRVTPDGEHLLFSSRAGEGLTGYDTGSCPDQPAGCAEFYVYSASVDGGEGALACVSCEPDGRRATAEAGVTHNVSAGTAASTPALPRALSDDGRRVFFSTGERLVEEDQNGAVSDVYVYNVPSGQVNLISTGRASNNSYFMGASPDGDDVIFATRERLVGSDRDRNYDLYDARVSGGFAEQVQPAPCEGGRCRGVVHGPPSPVRPASRDLRAPDGAPGSPFFRVLRLGSGARRRLAAGRPVSLSVVISQAGRVVARARATVRGRVRQVAFGSRIARHGGRVAVPLRLSRPALAQLRRTGRLRLRLQVRFAPVDVVKRQTFVLRVTRKGAR